MARKKTIKTIPKLKYRIEDILDKLPHKERNAKIKELQFRLKTSAYNLYRIRKIIDGSNSTANSDQLIIIADVLDTSIDYLLNRRESQNSYVVLNPNGQLN